MTDVMDFRQEARGCLRLAEAETQAELKTILMGMALGWLTLESHVRPAGGRDDGLGEDFVEDLAEELAPELAAEPVDPLVERRRV
jgi:hypothetical protein